MDASTSSSSSPASHSHAEGKCPVTGASGANPHAFCPPQEGDSRAPCPALNTMANHGYLPRNGQHLNADIIIKALKECYKLSGPLAWFLTHGALSLLGQSEAGGKLLSLHDLARHGGVEHNASLYHRDAGVNEYAPIHGDPQMLEAFFTDSADGKVMTPVDVGRVRARREATYPNSLDFIHAELARGEMGIVLNLFNNPNPELHAAGAALASPSLLSRILRRKPNPAKTPLAGVPCELLRYWFEHERLPEGWAPYHKTTLRETIVTVNTMRSAMWKYAKIFKREQAAHVVHAAPQSETEKEKVDVPVAPVSQEVVPALPTSAADPRTSPLAINTNDNDEGQIVSVPPSPGLTVSSATSSAFTEVLKTPQGSGFSVPPVLPAGKGVVSEGGIDGLPRIAEAGGV